jgi:hypothetical protein
MSGRARLLYCLLLATPGLAHAQGDERAAIAQERRHLEGVFAAEQAACANRFAVNACVEDVAERRRAALAPLRERELALDDAARRARAAQRRETAARQRAAASSPAGAVGAASAAEARPRQPARAVSGATGPRSAPDPALRASEAARRAAAAEQRAAEARKVQERSERREAERARAGKVARPLPVPASGAGR